MGLIRRYTKLPYEQRTVINAIIGLCGSAVLACAKLVIGILTDVDLVSTAMYSIAILLAKLECVLGVKTERRTFRTRNILIAAFLFVSSVLYIGFMSRLFFFEREMSEYSLYYVAGLAFISFMELGFAIAGLIRINSKGHFYRDIKIIDLSAALIAILTTQIAMLDYTASANSFINACSGMGVGLFIALSAVYILFAPRISVIDREHNVFSLADAEKNTLVDMDGESVEVVLSRSRVYAPYIFRAKIEGDRVEGDIVQGKSLWKRMHLLLKILCCILSEILIFVWLFGYIVYFFRTLNLPDRLERRMYANGFVRAETEAEK